MEKGSAKEGVRKGKAYKLKTAKESANRKKKTERKEKKYEKLCCIQKHRSLRRP